MPASAAQSAMVAPPHRRIKPGVGLTDDSREKSSNKPASDQLLFPVHPKRFVFLDKKTGSKSFEVRAGCDGRLPLEKAACLLAVQCVARQQLPSDFSITVVSKEDLVTSLAGRTKRLIEERARSLRCGLLSSRQYEVLGRITRNLTNKEIAALLHITERTVKFHVGVLLKKFGVRRRSELILEALDLHWFTRVRKHHARLHISVKKDDVKGSRLPDPIVVAARSSIEQRSAR